MRRMTARLFVLAALAAMGCGGGRGTPPEAPSLDPNGGRKTGPNLPPALLEALAGKSMFIEDFSSMMLFADERLAAQQIIADWGTANGLVIIPPATTEDVIAKANRGLDPTTGKACGPSLSRPLAVERWVAGDGSIKASVYCDPACTLQVEFLLRNKGTEFYAAPFDTGKPWREELAHQLASVVDNGGHERYGHANNPVQVTGIARGADDLIANRDADQILGADGTAIAQQCGATGLDVSVLVEAGTGGQIRCERYADAAYITESDPAIVACACDKIAARVKPAQRGVVRIDAPARVIDKVKTTAGKLVSADLIGGNEYRRFGVAWFVPGQLDAKVSHCFADRASVEDGNEVNATIEFDSDGRVAKAMIADVNALLKPGESECLQQAIRALRTPCPAEANPTATARISWWVSDP
jgi:hypothetical protein